jgi:hypothetical protein
MTITPNNVIHILSDTELSPVSMKPLYPMTKWDKFVHTKSFTIELSNGLRTTIQKGEKHDFASVPRILRPILSPVGSHFLAYLIHDHLYRNKFLIEELGKKKARKFADKEMLYWANILHNKSFFYRLDNKIRYWGVRLGGRKPFIT